MLEGSAPEETPLGRIPKVVPLGYASPPDFPGNHMIKVRLFGKDKPKIIPAPNLSTIVSLDRNGSWLIQGIRRVRNVRARNYAP